MLCVCSMHACTQYCTGEYLNDVLRRRQGRGPFGGGLLFGEVAGPEQQLRGPAGDVLPQLGGSPLVVGPQTHVLGVVCRVAAALLHLIGDLRRRLPAVEIDLSVTERVSPSRG